MSYFFKIAQKGLKQNVAELTFTSLVFHQVFLTSKSDKVAAIITQEVLQPATKNYIWGQRRRCQESHMKQTFDKEVINSAHASLFLVVSLPSRLHD